MLRSTGHVLILLFLAGRARSTVRTNDVQRNAQKQKHTLASGLKVSAKAWEVLIPVGFGLRAHRRPDPQARILPKQDGWRAGRFEPHRVATQLRFGPFRAKVALRDTGSSEEQLPPIEDEQVLTAEENTSTKDKESSKQLLDAGGERGDLEEGVEDLRLSYEFESREVEITEDLAGYLTEEKQEGKPRPTRACVLLPGAAGWRDEAVRRLADRLALFCQCMVLAPDLRRPDIAKDVYDATVYLRADHRVKPIALVGVSSGANHVLELQRTMPAASTFAAAVALCPSGRLEKAVAPLLVLLDHGPQQDALAGELEAALKVNPSPLRTTPLRTMAEASTGRPEADASKETKKTTTALSHGAPSRMRVAELREQLAARQLDTAGRKPELVARLLEALQDSRQSDVRQSAGALSRMRVAELREQLAARQLDTAGRKPELLARLQEALQDSRQSDVRQSAGQPVGMRFGENLVMQFPCAECWRQGATILSSSREEQCLSGETDALLMVEAWLNLHLVDRPTK